MKQQKGFTLIELLVVIVIIGILAAVVFVAIDPAQRFEESRDAARWSEVRSILDAILKYQVDNGGDLPTNLAAAPAATDYIIGTAVANCDDCGAAGVSSVAACLDVDNSGELVDEYLSEMPTDPDTGTDAETRYYITKSANGRLTVGACDAEQGVVKVKR